MVFNDVAGCDWLRGYEGDVNECKSSCLKESRCNAINHNDVYCQLRKCPIPAPDPTPFSGYSGYYYNKGT